MVASCPLGWRGHNRVSHLFDGGGGGWVCHASPMEGGVVGTVPVGLWVLRLWGAFVPRAGALPVGVGCSASCPLRWEGQWGAVVPCAGVHSLRGSVWCCITCFA